MEKRKNGKKGKRGNGERRKTEIGETTNSKTLRFIVKGVCRSLCKRGGLHFFCRWGGGSLAVLWAYETTLEILDLTNSGGRAESPTMIKMAKLETPKDHQVRKVGIRN